MAGKVGGWNSAASAQLAADSPHRDQNSQSILIWSPSLDFGPLFSRINFPCQQFEGGFCRPHRLGGLCGFSVLLTVKMYRLTTSSFPSSAIMNGMAMLAKPQIPPARAPDGTIEATQSLANYAGSIRLIFLHCIFLCGDLHE